MPYTILIAITVVVVSGLIAYLGDLLGRRMGKRRLSLFGLRPRYTAIVMTTITGMFIAALTIGALLTLSPGLRVIVSRAERVLKENQAYQVRNRELRDQNQRLTFSRSKLTDEVLRKSGEVSKAQRDVESARAAKDQAQRRVTVLEREIGSRLAELSELRRTGKATKQQLETIASKLQDRVEELAQRKTELRQRDVELAGKERDLARKNDDLASKIAALDKVGEDIRQAKDTIQQYEKTIRGQQDELMRTTKTLLTGDVVIPQGQELARRVIDSTVPPDQVKAELLKLLDSASQEAAKAGAGDGYWGIKLVFVDKSTATWIEDEGLCVDVAVNDIVQQGRASSDHGVLAQVIVVNNTLKDSRAPAVLNLYWNHLAFRRGDRIAARAIDGRMSEGRILLAVMDLLREDVRASAQAKGVVPIAGPNPDKASPEMSDEQLDRVIELVQTVHTQSRQVDLRAMARTDIYQAGPLTLDNIDFSISTFNRAAK